MRILNCFIVLLFSVPHVQAQPYVDVASAKYQYSPDAGVFRRSYQPNHFSYYNLGLNLPFVFKDSTVLLIGPAAEKWQIKSEALAGVPPDLYGLALPLTWVKPVAQQWTATVVFIPRWNGSEHFNFNDRLQLGGALLMTYKRSAALKYKLGLYYNREFFGNFFIPLAGIDWKISNRLQLFGVLPGNLVLERKVTRSFYYGASFRAITTSYRYGDSKNFIRIDDNQLNAFADLYLTRHLVLNAEVGHSFFRKFRTGSENSTVKYESSEKYNDDVLLRIALNYRVRFD